VMPSGRRRRARPPAGSPSVASAVRRAAGRKHMRGRLVAGQFPHFSVYPLHLGRHLPAVINLNRP
jgi:hypothetical protein